MRKVRIDSACDTRVLAATTARRISASRSGSWTSSAIEGTGQLRVADDGHFRLVVDDLDRPTSLEFIGDTAYVVSLGGEVWRIPDVCGD